MLQCSNEIVPAANEEFLCVNSDNNKEILYNIILDDKFKAIDAKAREFLEWNEKSKDYYFWENATSSYFQWVELIGLKYGKFWEYWQEYKKICNSGRADSIQQTTIRCYEEGANENRAEWADNVTMTIDQASKFFTEWVCMKLAEAKLEVYETIAYDLLKINKAQIRSDNRKRFQKIQRNKYERVLTLMRINIGLLERIWKKWPQKTKNTLDA